MRRITVIFAVVALFTTVSFAQNSGHLLINNDNVTANSADIDTVSATGALKLLKTVSTGGTGLGSGLRLARTQGGETARCPDGSTVGRTAQG